MKKKISYCLMFILLLMATGIQAFPAKAAAATYTTNDVAKEWKIIFAQNVDPKTVTPEAIYITNENGEKVTLNEVVVDKKAVLMSAKNNFAYGKYNIHIEPTIKSVDGYALTKKKELSFVVEETKIENKDVVYKNAGTFGGKTYLGNVEIQQADTTLKDAVIEGDLTIAASVGEGEVYLQNVTVKGETKILGGGSNSVYLKDTTLANVIVNKENGTIRVVVEGNTVVANVSLETPAILMEDKLKGEGFTEVLIQERVANYEGEIVLNGTFKKVQTFATGLDLNLASDTQISELILSALTTVVGDAKINNLQVALNGSGSKVEAAPENAVLDNGTVITVADQEVTESFSNVEKTSIEDLEATAAFTQINFTSKKFDITLDDFDINATSYDETITLNNLKYNSSTGMLTYTIPEKYLHSQIQIEVKAAPTSSKVSGSATRTFNYAPGVQGRITDIYGMGIANVAITVEGEYNHNRSKTNASGYYYITRYNEEPLQLKVTAPGYVEGTIFVYNSQNTSNDLVLIRAAASDEWKIRLTWNGEESDVDSHLSSENFHVYYSDRSYVKGGLEYVDLDWDDTDYYGPETTTIRKFEDGRYIFFIHNFSGDKPLEKSDSKIEVFKGNKTVPDYEYTVPQQTNGERYWGVFELLVSDNGKKIEVVEVDAMSKTGAALMNPRGALQQLIDETDLTISHKPGFNQAYNAAQAALMKDELLTTKKYVELYNALYNSIAFKTVFSSGSGMFELSTFDGNDGKFSTTINMTLDVKPLEEWYEHTVQPGDIIEVSAYVEDYYYETEAELLDTIQVKNIETGKVLTLPLNERSVIIENITYEQLLQLAGNEYELTLGDAGRYYINLMFKAINREVSESDDYTYNPTEYMSLDLISE